MKKSTLFIVIAVCFCSLDANAIPKCLTGVTGSVLCNDYMWDEALAAFSCGAGKCSCRTTNDYDCYNPCDETCTANTSCAAYSTGYQKCTTTSCTPDFYTATCTSSTKTTYRCAAGYYGSSTNGTSGCTRCPYVGTNALNQMTLVYGTSTAGSTSQTSCYASTSSSIKDTSGIYQYTNNCYYTN